MDGDNCFEAYLAHCSPFRLAPPFDFIGADPHAFLGPPDPTAVLRALQFEYPASTLIDAGIAQLGVGEVLELHPFLAPPGTSLIALRDPRLGHLNNLMTPAGCVTVFRYPLFSAVHDQHNYNAIDRTDFGLLLTGDLEDAIILRSFGFAAAPIVGLTEIGGLGLTYLGRYFGVKRILTEPELDGTCVAPPATLDEQPDVQRIYAGPKTPWSLPGCHRPGENVQYLVTLCISKWSPKNLSLVEPSAIAIATEYLVNLQKHCDIDITEVAIWAPTYQQIAALQFALARRDVEAATRTLFTSVDWTRRTLTVPPPTKPPSDFATAVEDMQQSLLSDTGDADSQKRRRSAHATYVSAVQREVVGPLLLQTSSIADPVQRAMHLQYAEMSALFFSKMPAIRDQLYIGPKTNVGAIDPGPIREALAIGNQIRALASELRR